MITLQYRVFVFSQYMKECEMKCNMLKREIFVIRQKQKNGFGYI